MKFNEKNVPEKSKKNSGSLLLYIAGAIVAVFGVALLIDNIMLFNSNVNQYVTQGYAAADVIKQLMPAQLLPGIFEPVALYGGIALLLFAAGFINQKVSSALTLLTEAKVSNDPTDDSVIVETITEVIEVEPLTEEETIVEVVESIKQEEILEKDSETSNDNK
ncbi:MAG: hypothetical protein JJE18_06810 [Eubacteriaceae bacterium]|nr:hypothetical protein [Eubacteriaceae bacterium]